MSLSHGSRTNPLIPLPPEEQEALHEAMHRPRAMSSGQALEESLKEFRLGQLVQTVQAERPGLALEEMAEEIARHAPGLAPDAQVRSLLARWGFKPKQQQQRQQQYQPPALAGVKGDRLPMWERPEAHRRLPPGQKGLPCVAGAPNPNLTGAFSLDGTREMTAERAEQLADLLCKRVSDR
jgi:hypothetical protein